MNPGTFPGPWRVEPTSSAFVIKDAKGFSVAHIYWKPQSALREQYFSQSEALVVAELDLKKIRGDLFSSGSTSPRR
jgi:hypothetical protein